MRHAWQISPPQTFFTVEESRRISRAQSPSDIILVAEEMSRRNSPAELILPRSEGFMNQLSQKPSAVPIKQISTELRQTREGEIVDDLLDKDVSITDNNNNRQPSQEVTHLVFDLDDQDGLPPTPMDTDKEGNANSFAFFCTGVYHLKTIVSLSTYIEIKLSYIIKG